MKRLEIQLFIDINDKQTDTDDIIFHFATAIDDIINGVVKRVNLIDEIEVE